MITDIKQMPVPAESVDLTRPDLFNEDDFMKWGEMHSWIRESDTPVAVNSAFYFIDDILQKAEGGYGGGGFRYVFWFHNTDDKMKFILKYAEIFE